jgi:glycosyltransferase involved in cell wall biosynthesis
MIESAQQPAVRFTVFTPTYNRASTMHRVYESLQKQTFRSFEWLIVDDGSTDDTEGLVSAWQKTAAFPIRYVTQPNQGKHIAFNRGVAEARGELFLTLDSDDACVPSALERFNSYWDTIPEGEKDRYSAVTCLCVDENGRLVGDRFPRDVTDSDSLEIRYRYHVRGEKWGFHRTAVLRQYPFPNKPHYIPESLVWTRIARRYKTRFVNEPLRVYFNDQPSLSTEKAWRMARGVRLLHLTALNEEVDYFRYAPVQFLRSAVHYVRFSRHAGVGLREQFADLNNALARALWVLALPLGLAVYLRDEKAQPRSAARTDKTRSTGPAFERRT